MNPEEYFHKIVVVITGASSGIGKALAVAFAHEGASTILVSRKGERLENAAAEIRGLGYDAIAIAADVSSADQVRHLVADVLENYGRIDILINNAGASQVGSAEDDAFASTTRQIFETSFYGTLHLNQSVIPLMRAQQSGQIVNMSSVVGRKAFPRFGSYSAVMHAITGYSDALRQELTPAGISVMTLHPGLTQTELLTQITPDEMPPPFRFMTPMSPEFVARRILRAIKKGKSRMILPYQARVLLFMDALSPRIGDWIVRMMSYRFFARLLGIYRGATYVHRTST